MKRRFIYTGMFIVIMVLLTLSGQALANNFVRGSSSNADVAITSSTEWVVIRSVSINIPGADDNEHGCVATASADVENPGSNLENQYRFVLSRNSTSPSTNGGSERIVELRDNAEVDDPDSVSVSTTLAFTGITNTNGEGGTGLHTFYLLGRKVSVADSNTDVLDASLSLICVHAR